ncbi:hypothetical protein FHS14_002553, partial [Paenibacillus baekrokdamisoli]
QKNKRHRAFSHTVSDSIFIPYLVFELNLMTLSMGMAFLREKLAVTDSAENRITSDGKAKN